MPTEAQIRKLLNDNLKKPRIDYQKVLELSAKLAKYDKNNFHFSIDAGALVNLGRDSIKDHTTALIELVKNGYDEDATRIEIDIFSEKKKEVIRVADNGNGMSQNEVIGNWLRIGYSAKKKNKTTKKKRRKTGEKGIGRLSADRLGASLKLITKSARNNVFGLDVKWNDFDAQGVDLNLIPLKRINNPSVKIPKGLKSKNTTGTELIISDLRNSWADVDLKNLWRELSVLTPPFKKIRDFEIWINTDIETEYKGKVEPQMNQAAEVSLVLNFDGKSDKIKYSLSNKYKLIPEKNKSISWTSLIQQKDNFLKDIKKIPTKKELKCGPVEFQLLFYPREASMIEGTGFKLGQLQEYLDENNGIKIYRDNISVKPYGFPNVEGSDWLDLSLRQGQDPAGIGRPGWMVKPNQLVGAVFITRDKNAQLKDSTAREGLIHEDSFYDLRALVLAGIRLLEIHRHELYKLNPKEKKIKRPTKQILEEYKDEIVKLKTELEVLQKQAKGNKIFENAKVQVEVVIQKTDETEKTIEELLDKARVLAGLATVGISSAVFGHETEIAISEVKLAAGNARMELDDDPLNIESIKEEIDKALKYSEHVLAWGNFALSRVKRDKRKKSYINVKEIVEKIVGEILPNFNAVEITVIQNLNDVYGKVFAMDIETVLLNLLTNAYSAVSRKTIKIRKIRIELLKSKRNGKEGFNIIVADSGHGVDDKIKEMIWQEFYTTKVDDKGKSIGTGLGLAIVKSIVEDLQGEKSIEKDSVLKGAKFSIWMPSN